MDQMYVKVRGTIGCKLMLLATISVSVALMLTCSVFAWYGITSLRNIQSEQLSLQAQLLALNSAAVVEFRDTVQADRLLAAMKAEPSVTSAGLFSSDDQLVGSYPTRQVAESVFVGTHTHPSEYYIIKQPIVRDGETVGQLKLAVDFTSLSIAMRNYAILTVVIGLGAWIVALSVAFVLQRGLVRPICRLADIARKVADGGNYALRVEGQATGELGDLYRAINGMLTQVQSSKQQLQELNDNLECRVVERTNQLELALDAAQSASRAKSVFLANMSHEIRTPLNAIMGYADLLRRGWVDSEDERTEMLATVHTSGRHLMTVLNDILDLSKIESGRMELEIRAESPHSILSEVVSLMRVSFHEKNLSLDYSWQGPIPAQIQTDTARLRQILINLLGNARKFTSFGGVQIIARLDRDQLTARLVVEVIDTGVGIPSEKQESIFEPFVQADTSVTRKFGGTGLGLSISRRLARMMGGDLTVASQPGKGSDFRLSIPVTNADTVSFLASGSVGDVIQTRKSTATETMRLPSLRGLRVLVVDDGISNRKLISLVLTRAGATMSEAENGQQACDIVLSGRGVDVVLLDMQMPVMDGYAAARRLREAGITIPIIALTAHAMKGDREKCIGAGCSDFLSKPVATDELLARMASLMTSQTVDGAAVPIVSERQPIHSKLPTDDPEFAEIVVDFVAALKREVARLSDGIKNRDPVVTRTAAHWIKGSGGTAGFPCFSLPAVQISEAVRHNKWADIGRHLDAILEYTDRIQIPASAASS